MKRICITFVFIFTAFFLSAQGFGFDDDSSGFEFTFGGELSAGTAFYFDNFLDDSKLFNGDFFEARTTFDFSFKNAQIFLGLNLSYNTIKELIEWEDMFDPYHPAMLDEFWIRGFFNNLTIQAGFMKTRWGKMYSPGPLDVLNPLDYTDLTLLTEPMNMKIARPMLLASYNIGSFSKIEAVFIPNFAPHRFDTDGRWTPSQFSNMVSVFAPRIIAGAASYPPLATILPAMLGQADFSGYKTETSDIKNFQAGMRFNTVIGQADIGFQYFYGNYFRPSISISDEAINAFLLDLIAGNPSFTPPFYTGDISLLSPIEYSRYHQIGADYSQVLSGFNVRGELAVHLTNDLRGDNRGVKNPFISWSLGFDRDIFAEININFQCNESIRLFNGNVIDNPALDSEGGSGVTSTRFIIQLSRSFLRDKLEIKLVNIWDVEDSGYALLPSVSVEAADNFIFNISAGIFAGDKDSELGQYRDNAFLKIKFKYLF